MKHLLDNKITYVMLTLFTIAFTFVMNYIKHEGNELMWSNGFGVFCLLFLLFGYSMIISLNANID